MTRCLRLTALFAFVSSLALAHEVRPALLKVSEVSDGRYLVHWKVPAMGDKRLAIDPIFDSGCAEADDRVNGFASGASVRSWIIECEDGLADTEVEFSNLSSTMIDVLVQVTFLDSRYYSGLVRPSAPTYQIPARDAQVSVFRNYIALGVEHILFGLDHLLFVLGMIFLVTDYRRLLWAITGFTFAHSITLALATLDVIRVPGPPVEAIIALSIVFVAVEAARYRRSKVSTMVIRSPWLVSMVIGLVHGLGFAGALTEYGLPAHARFVSLLAFNLGVEFGQLMFIGAILVLAAAAKRIDVLPITRFQAVSIWGIGVCGAFWLVQRVVGFF